jgi:hypothetical protein
LRNFQELAIGPALGGAGLRHCTRRVASLNRFAGGALRSEIAAGAAADRVTHHEEHSEQDDYEEEYTQQLLVAEHQLEFAFLVLPGIRCGFDGSTSLPAAICWPVALTLT